MVSKKFNSECLGIYILRGISFCLTSKEMAHCYFFVLLGLQLTNN
jgi:hypothetical protein